MILMSLMATITMMMTMLKIMLLMVLVMMISDERPKFCQVLVKMFLL